MKRITFIVIGALCFLAVNYLLTGYGNRVVHRGINSVMVDKFQSNFITAAFPLAKFKNYTFVFDGTEGLPGLEVETGGYLDMEEAEAKKNARQWIVHGGYSADEPELYASFRHFYDPTEPAGNRYLHNHLDQMEAINPQIDHIDWAIKHPEHAYNWENGLAAVESAITSPDSRIKNENMAFAYRALGETLHLIADMGCPSHVRDDSHAAEPFTGYQFGSPDPYEEFFEDFSDIKTNFSDGKTDAGLQSAFRSAETVQSIAEKLAQYTNANFFTNQTISGESVAPLIHPEKTYESPKLEECTYDDLTYTYSKNISGNVVMMCRDLRFRLGIFSTRGYPYIDKACVHSQGKALMPQILEAGANAIRLFIPTLEVTIDEFDEEEKVISGKVKHIKTVEYPRNLKYSGNVAIYKKKTMKKIMDVACVNGEFEQAVNLSDFRNIDWKKDGIYAEINFGGITVKSDPYTENLSIKAKMIRWDVSMTGTYKRSVTRDGETYEETIEQDDYMELNSLTNIRQVGGSITATLDTTYQNSAYTTRRKALVTIELDGINIRSFEVTDSLFENRISPNNNDYTFHRRHYKSKENPPFEVNQDDYIRGAYYYLGVTHECLIFNNYEGRSKIDATSTSTILLNVKPDPFKSCTFLIFY